MYEEVPDTIGNILHALSHNHNNHNYLFILFQRDRTTEHLLPMAASALSQQRCQLRSIMVSLNNDVDVLPLAVPNGNIAPRQPLLNVR